MYVLWADAYDQQWCSSKKSDRKTGFQETFSKHENKIEEFIHKEIYPEIAEIERTELSCWKWYDIYIYNVRVFFRHTYISPPHE